MLQSHAKQIQIRYMTELRKATELRPEDLGCIRLAMSMALEELQDMHRQNLAEIDDINADLLHQLDQLKSLAATDAGEILRLQTMEDRLATWLSEHEPLHADMVAKTGDVCAAIVCLLDSRNGSSDEPTGD